VWLAGAGVKQHFPTEPPDEFATKPSKNVTTIYDLHATILHLLGLDHERLSFYHNGIERRLTDFRTRDQGNSGVAFRSCAHLPSSARTLGEFGCVIQDHCVVADRRHAGGQIDFLTPRLTSAIETAQRPDGCASADV